MFVKGTFRLIIIRNCYVLLVSHTSKTVISYNFDTIILPNIYGIKIRRFCYEVLCSRRICRKSFRG